MHKTTSKFRLNHQSMHKRVLCESSISPMTLQHFALSPPMILLATPANMQIQSEHNLERERERERKGKRVWWLLHLGSSFFKKLVNSFISGRATMSPLDVIRFIMQKRPILVFGHVKLCQRLQIRKSTAIVVAYHGVQHEFLYRPFSWPHTESLR